MHNTNYSERLVNLIHQHQGHEPGLFWALKDLVDEYHDVHYHESSNAIRIDELVDYHKSDMREDGGIARYATTTFMVIRELLGGFREGWLYMITGDCGSGKTRLLINLALSVARCRPTLYVSANHDAMGTGVRMFSVIRANAGFNGLKSQEGMKYGQHDVRLNHPEARLYSLFLLGKNPQTLEGVIAQIIRYHRDEGVSCVFIDDPEQLLGSTPASLLPYRRRHLYRRLHEVCREYPLSIMMARRREVSDMIHSGQTPGLRTLEQQGYMLDDVDVVLHYGTRAGAAWYDPIRQVNVLKYPRPLSSYYFYLFEDARRDYIRDICQKDLPDDLGSNNVFLNGMEELYGFDPPDYPVDDVPF